MSLRDELRSQVADHPLVKEAAGMVRIAREDLVKACTGTRPIDMRRIGPAERSILYAASRFRSANNDLNAAVAEAVREMMEAEE